MRIKIIIALIVLLAFSCDSVQEQIYTLKDDTLRISSNVLIESNGDSTSYMQERTKNRNIFISVLPADKWIDSMQQLNGEEGWNEVVADNEHYRNQTEVYLTSKGYSELPGSKEGIWSIKRPNCHINVINFDTLADQWGVVIFSGDYEPFFYDGTEPEIDLDTL